MSAHWTEEDRARCLAMKAEGRTAPQIAAALDKTVEAVRGVWRREREMVRAPVSKFVYRREFEIPPEVRNDDDRHLTRVAAARPQGFPAWHLPAAYRVAA